MTSTSGTTSFESYGAILIFPIVKSKMYAQNTKLLNGSVKKFCFPNTLEKSILFLNHLFRFPPYNIV